jgi:hypothetical protein
LLILLLGKFRRAEANLDLPQVLVTLRKENSIASGVPNKTPKSPTCPNAQKQPSQSMLLFEIQETAVSDSFPGDGVWVDVQDAEFFNFLLGRRFEA